MTRCKHRKFPRTGVYAITSDQKQSLGKLVDQVEGAIIGGACVIQYRSKQDDKSRCREEAAALADLCRRLNVPFIVNDDIALARAVDADGVHIGKDDGDFAPLRTQLGEDLIIGISCYASVDRAVRAEAFGASYVAFGRFFPSESKPHATPCPISTLSEAKRRLSIPIVAIGGITPENGALLVEAGADLLAIIGGIFGRAHPAQATRRYKETFTH